MYRGIIERYRGYLPVTPATPVISLLEGNTPLIPAPRLAEALQTSRHIYLKFEGLNPTSSFKDRGMTLAVSKAVEAGAKAIICASTGNTSASAAAYAARAGLTCVVLVPAGAIALGKLCQALMHGAKVVTLEGNFDAALTLVKEISHRHAITLVNSINPYRLEGQKTGAFEVVDALGEAPDYHLTPVGNAGNITAYWRGYQEYAKAGKCHQLPRMIGFQAEGAAPIVRGAPVADPQTIATAIRIGNPASWQGALAARDESGGLIDSVTDDEIVEAYTLLAKTEGVFCEPASASAVAGLGKLIRQGTITGSGVAVCVLTGHGLKDPDRALAVVPRPEPVPATMEHVLKEIGL